MREHLDRRGFADVEVVDLHGVEAAKTPVDSPVVRTAVGAWEDLGSRRRGRLSDHRRQRVRPSLFAGGAWDTHDHDGQRGERRRAASTPPTSPSCLDDYFETVRYFTRFFERFGGEGPTA